MYAYDLCRALGLDLENGVVRESLVHYNTVEEVERFGVEGDLVPVTLQIPRCSPGEGTRFRAAGTDPLIRDREQWSKVSVASVQRTSPSKPPPVPTMPSRRRGRGSGRRIRRNAWWLQGVGK